MGKSCAIIPTIKVDGKEVESKLFSDLLSLTGNRETTKYIWGLTRVPEFTSLLKNIELDSNGEPTIQSLNKALDLKSLLKGGTSLFIEKQEVGAIDENGETIHYKKANDIVNKVIDYNRNNEDIVANVVKTSKGYSITLNNKTIENSDVPNQLMFKNALNNKLLGIVRRLGFDVEVDGNLIYDGIFDPTNAEYTAEGLRTVIKIAKGKLGEEAFPEEFSHLIIAGLTKEPLVNRLLNSLSNEVIIEVLGEEFDSYSRKYDNNIDLLRLEAAAKLLHNHIVNPVKQESILSRIWNWIKTKFRRLDESSIDEAIRRANNGFAKLATKIMDESILDEIDKDEILNSKPLYKLGEETNRMQELAEHSLEVASKRLEIIRARAKSGRYSEKDIISIKNLQKHIENKKYAKSCSAFLIDSLSQIETMQNSLNRLLDKDVRGDNSLSKIRRISSVLREIKEFSDGYTPIIKQLTTIQQMKKAGEVDITEEDAATIAEQASKISIILNSIEDRYQKLRFEVVYNFLKIYLGDDKIKGVNKDGSDTITLEQLLKIANKDINGLDRWISSLSDASDPLLSIIDKVVKVTKANRDRILGDVLIELRGVHKKLTSAGYNTEFMFEKDAQGKLTGRIISDYDFDRFNKERAVKLKELKDEGHPNYVIKSKIEAWERKYLKAVVVDESTGRTEMLPIYKKEVLSKLSSPQREYYDSMIKAKAMLEGFIPERYTNLYNAVQVRNDMVMSVLENWKSPKDVTKQVLSNLRDNFIRRSDDTEFGDNTINKLLDFSGKPISRLPVYYTTPLEDTSRLSTDFTGAMVAYAGMAINYKEMNSVIDALELTRSLVKDREVQQYSGNSKLAESFKVIHKQFTRAYTKKGEVSNIGARLDDYFENAIYNKSKKDEGTIANSNVDTAKTMDSLKTYTSLAGLGLNIFSATSNIVAGNMQLFIDAVGGEYFNMKNLAIGSKNYYALLPKYLAELGTPIKTNKLSLLIDKFDALEEFFKSQQEQGNYKGPMAKILGNTNLYFLNSAGEHYLHCRTMLAMLDAYKVKLGDKTISLYEALEVEEIKENGKVVSAKLKLKDGVTNLDGSNITEENYTTLKLKIGKVNQSLNGAFREEDKGAIHRLSLGRLGMLFRQWMPAHYYRRFARKYYDATLDQWREGYYMTFGRFTLDLMKDLVRARFEIGTHWKSLTEHQKANIRRTFAELSLWVMLTITLALTGPEKEWKGVWGMRKFILTVKRALLELGASIPITPDFDFMDNILTIVQNPSAAIKTVGNLLDLLKFQNMLVEVESGRYKGWSEYEKDLVETLIVYGKVRAAWDLATDDSLYKIYNR